MIKMIKRLIKGLIWRHRNRHNLTTLKGDNFPLNNVVVGKMTYGSIHAICFDAAKESLIIGNFCSIADEVVFLLGGGHRLDLLSTFPFRAKLFGDVQASTKGPIVVEDDVWIGYGATILSGVTLGKGCVIGARALVCNDVPPYAVVAGVPAKIIKFRFDECLREELINFNLDYVDPSFVRDHINLFEKTLDGEVLAELKLMLE